MARFPRRLDFLSWSPDGRSLAFRSRDRLWVVEAAGGEPRAVGEASSSGRSVAWAPSGRELVVDAAWTGGAGVLGLVPLDGSPVRPLTRGSGGLHEPSLARDGLIVRRKHPTDRRQTLVYLSAPGRALRDRVIHCAQDVNILAAGDLDPEEVARCRRVLARMIENLQGGR